MKARSRLNRKIRCVVSAACLLAGVASVSSCAWLQDRRDEKEGIQLQSLQTPVGYQVTVLATGLPKARNILSAKEMIYERKLR